MARTDAASLRKIKRQRQREWVTRLIGKAPKRPKKKRSSLVYADDFGEDDDDEVTAEVEVDTTGAIWKATFEDLTLSVDQSNTLEQVMKTFSKRLGFKVVPGSVWLREAGKQPLTMRKALRFVRADGDGNPMWDRMPCTFMLRFKEVDDEEPSSSTRVD